MDRREEFLRMFLKHEWEIRAFTGSLVQDRNLREDVFQEVALTLWKKFDQFDASRSFAAWARGFAANKVLQGRDRLQRVPRPFSPEVIQAICDAWDRRETATRLHEESEALDHCLERVPEKSRRLLVLRYEQGLKLYEIAQRVGVSLDATAQALSRLRSRLHDCMTRWLTARGVT